MRRIGLPLWIALCLAPVGAQDGDGGKFADTETGLVIQVPDGWSRETRREAGGVRFAGIFDLTPSRYVLFTVEAGPAAGYDEEAWLEIEQATQVKALQGVTTPFKTERIELAGEPATRYTIAGRIADADGREYDLRVRACGIVSSGRFFKITEVSYNGAHEEAAVALRAIWAAVGFRECIAEEAIRDDGSGEPDTSARDGEPRAVRDETGNFELTLPSGWVIVSEPPQKPGARLRLHATRETEDREPLIELFVMRETETRAEVFSVESAADRLDALRKARFFERWYGEGSASAVAPRVDGGKSLGGAEKSSGYEFRSVTMPESKRIEEARKLAARVDGNGEVPHYADLVLRGRIAMLSPHVYNAVAVFSRRVSDDERLVAELDRVLDSWRFLVFEERPPPLVVNRKSVGDTRSDPRYGKDRPQVHVYREKARRMFKLELSFVVPAGFRRVIEGLGPGVSLRLVAQDDRNNWVTIVLRHVDLTRSGETRRGRVPSTPEKDICDQWRSDWTSRASGVKGMGKPQEISFGGPLRGEGYKFVPGTVERFRGTFSGFVAEASSWRTLVEIETRGDGDRVFAAGIEKFFRSLALKRIK